MRRLAAGLVLGSAITILAAGGWTSAAAQGDAGGRALTAGQLILVAGTPDAAMLSGLREALASDQAPMRALAAQLIGASRILALQRELMAAASREAAGDGTQASLLRALLLLDTPETRREVEQQVAAGTPRARLAWAAWLARTSPVGLADALPALAQGLDADDSWWLIQHVQRASIRGPGTGPALHAALLATLGDRYRGAGGERSREFSEAAAAVLTPAAPRLVPHMRSIEPLPAGVLSSLMSATRCEPTTAFSFGALQMTYRQDGRPATAAVGAGALSAGCGEMVRALARIILEAEDYDLPVGTAEWVVVPFQRDLVACLDRPWPRATRVQTGPEASSSTIRAPRKIRNVSPRYPPQSQAAQVQGIVVVESTIDPSGCIQSGRVLSGPSTALALAALEAVLQWRYTPTLLDGQPVSVLMTVTVNFTLN